GRHRAGADAERPGGRGHPGLRRGRALRGAGRGPAGGRPGQHARRGRDPAAGGRPHHGQPGDRDHRAGHRGAEVVHLPRPGGGADRAAHGRGGRRRAGQQPRRGLRPGRPAGHPGGRPGRRPPRRRHRRRRGPGVRAALRRCPGPQRRAAGRQPGPGPDAGGVDGRRDDPGDRLGVRRPAAHRGPGGPGAGRDRRGLPALGRGGAELPERGPAGAGRPAGRGRRRRGRRHPLPPAAGQRLPRRHLRRVRAGQLPLVAGRGVQQRHRGAAADLPRPAGRPGGAGPGPDRPARRAGAGHRRHRGPDPAEVDRPARLRRPGRPPGL
ncbi:MAG: CapA protein, partial [uncultured Corynebacteriales bacterium]